MEPLTSHENVFLMKRVKKDACRSDLFRHGNRITAGLGFFVKSNLAG